MFFLTDFYVMLNFLFFSFYLIYILWSLYAQKQPIYFQILVDTPDRDRHRNDDSGFVRPIFHGERVLWDAAF